ncbi:hypothetical protein FTUN_3631 [Frigoriglobus tundricola]|uniref:Uncharacterized protein n=1 Tax=Frigoriglobus tundricola TaxID=2774151 RepID=A0A6M5YPW1_9BACT|nr:hypothetical protein FTUN_3631 [Frigoriglobus tundricola]
MCGKGTLASGLRAGAVGLGRGGLATRPDGPGPRASRLRRGGFADSQNGPPSGLVAKPPRLRPTRTICSNRD